MRNEQSGRQPLLLTARDAAAFLAISPRKLWSLTASHEIPHVRIGRSVRYRADALASWVEDHESDSKGGDA